MIWVYFSDPVLSGSRPTYSRFVVTKIDKWHHEMVTEVQLQWFFWNIGTVFIILTLFTYEFYRQNVCSHPQKIHMLNPNTQCDVFGGEWNSHEWIHVLRKETPGSCLAFSTPGGHKRTAVCETGRRFLSDTVCTSDFILDFPVHGNVRKKKSVEVPFVSQQ